MEHAELTGNKEKKYKNGIQKGLVAIIHHIREDHGVCHRLMRCM